MSAQDPYAPPTANLDVNSSVADIDNLPVSDSWKRSFRAIHKAGGPNFPNLKNLPPEDRKAVIKFNVLAFLFGPFYYLFKGMWKKGLTILDICVVGLIVLDVIMTYMGFAKFTGYTKFVAPTVYSLLANLDYYRKMVLGQNGWWWPSESARNG
jgi:hypothetical protein